MSGCCTSLRCQQRAVFHSLSAQCLFCLLLGPGSACDAVMEPARPARPRLGAQTGDPRGKAVPAPRCWQREVLGLLPSQPCSTQRGERCGLTENAMNLELLPLLINRVISLLAALSSSSFVSFSSFARWRSSDTEDQRLGQLSALEPICRSQNKAQMADQRANHEVTLLPSCSPYKNG